MTTGVRTIGALYPTHTSCGTAYVGTLHSRSWNGTDSLPGQLRENPYSCDISVTVKPLIKWGPQLQYTGEVSTCFGGSADFEPLPSGKLSELRNNSLKRVVGKYKMHDFNMATFLGELPETVDMVGSSALAVFRSYRAVRKGRFHQAVKILRDINVGRNRTFKVDRHASSNWLALRYGWMPLLSDAYSAVDAYESTTKSDTARGALFRGRSKFVRKARSVTTSPSSRYVHYDQVILRTRVKPTLLQSLGFSDPELVAWELLPFSFVVDWFYNIGSYLEMRAVLPRTESAYILTTMEHSLNSGYSDPRRNAFAPLFRIESRSIRRTVSSSVVVPPPRLKNPFEIKNNMTRLTDALALGLAVTRR